MNNGRVRPAGGNQGLPFGWAGKTATAAVARGAPPFGWLSQARIGGPDRLIDDGMNLSAAHYILMCVSVINLTDDEIHAASRIKVRPGTSSTGLRIMASAQTLRTSIDALIRFYTMIGQREKITLVTSGSTTRLEISEDIADPGLSATVHEMVAISLHCQFSFILDRLLPLYALVTHGDHPFTNRTHPYLGCPVLRGRKTALVLPSWCLDLKPVARLGDRPVTDAVLCWLRQLDAETLAGFDRQDLKPVGAAVFDRLRDRDLSFSECGAELRLPDDDLRRALSVEGTGYRTLRHRALIERIRPYLTSGASLDDVAPALGYSDARSLRRSVRSASGLSVTELRTAICTGETQRDPMLLTRLRHQLEALG